MLYTVVHRDEVILSESRLEDLLLILADIHDTDEDAAVWFGPHVVCVRHGRDGSITWLDARHRPAAAA